jgi:hypothetical protein
MNLSVTTHKKQAHTATRKGQGRQLEQQVGQEQGQVLLEERELPGLLEQPEQLAQAFSLPALALELVSAAVLAGLALAFWKGLLSPKHEFLLILVLQKLFFLPLALELWLQAQE